MAHHKRDHMEPTPIAQLRTRPTPFQPSSVSSATRRHGATASAITAFASNNTCPAAFPTPICFPSAIRPAIVYDTATQQYLQFQPDGTATTDNRHPFSQQGAPLPPFTYSPAPTIPTAPTHPHSISPTAPWVPREPMQGRNHQATIPPMNPAFHNTDGSPDDQPPLHPEVGESIGTRRSHHAVGTLPSEPPLHQRHKRRKSAQGPTTTAVDTISEDSDSR